MKAKPLSPGATVGVIAPGSSCDAKSYNLGLEEIKRRGYEVKAPLSPTMFFGRFDHGFASAGREARAAVLSQLINDPEVGVILAARGGQGTMEMLPFLDIGSLKKCDKCIVGCSDVTALLIAALSKAEAPVIYGPVIAEDFMRAREFEPAQTNVDKLFALLTDPLAPVAASCCEVFRAGKGRGKIIAGRLSLLVSLLGTPYDMSYDGAILVVENRGEEPYRVYRSLTQLRLAGKLEKLSALIFGRFSDSEAGRGPTVEEVLTRSADDIMEGTEFPVLAGLAFGYGGVSHPLPLGCEAEVEGDVLRLLESPLSRDT